MTRKILLVGAVALVLSGLAVLAASPFSGSWDAALAVSPATLSFSQFSSVLTVDYTLGAFTTTSDSEVYLAGFIWQGFGITGSLGGFTVQGDVLFGPSTASFLYDQLIVTTNIAGIDLGLYAAQLSGDVLGGPADGAVLRIAGSIGSLEVVNCFEMGARIKDADYHGITIVHASTGLSKTYITNPLVPGQGFTGDKLTVSGWSFACLSDGSASLYMTDQGLDSLELDLTGIKTGLSWLTLDLALTFELQTKAVVLTPTLNLGTAACIVPYLDVRTPAADNTLSPGLSSITGISLDGLSITYTAGNVTLRDLTVLDTGRYAITTEDYGSRIESYADALANGDQTYPDYWELLSLAVSTSGCCGGTATFLVNTYFTHNTTGLLHATSALPESRPMGLAPSFGNLFGWGMTHIEASLPVNHALSFTALFEVSTTGIDQVGGGINLTW